MLVLSEESCSMYLCNSTVLLGQEVWGVFSVWGFGDEKILVNKWPDEYQVHCSTWPCSE